MTNATNPDMAKAFSGMMPGLGSAQKFWLAVARMQGNGLKAALRYNVETLDFVKHRIERDIALFDELTRSDGYKDAFDVCSCFVEEAVAEYSSEAGKLASLGSKIASETADEVRKEATATIEDMAASSVA